MPAGDMTTVGPIAPKQNLQRSSASARPKNPRDLTGKRKQELEAQAADEKAARENEMAMVTAAASKVRTDEVVDYTRGGHSSPSILAAQAAQVEEADETEVEAPFVVIRVNSPIEDMVFGRTVTEGDPEHGIPPTAGTLQFYSFEEGTRYEVPSPLAKHLEKLGYLYH